MATPYLPVQLATPVVNPAVGSIGPPAIPYVSNSQYNFAPTGVSGAQLVPGTNTALQAQALADTIARASAWVDNHCFGADPATKGASIAASLSVQSGRSKVKNGGLALSCDYKPILQVTGVDIGYDPSSVVTIGASLAQSIEIRRRTIIVPMLGFPIRTGDSPPAFVPLAGNAGGLYVVWSYVNGYPHTYLTANVTRGATSCVVSSTDGTGGLWGVYPASGAFPGTRLTIYDGAETESVFVTAITPGSTTTTLTTTAFANAHTAAAAPDFLPVTALPPDVQQAAISFTSVLIKLRGTRSTEMRRVGTGPGAGKKEMAQAGALDDYNEGCRLLRPYVVHQKG